MRVSQDTTTKTHKQPQGETPQPPWAPAPTEAKGCPFKGPLPSVPISSCSLWDVVVRVMRTQWSWRSTPPSPNRLFSGAEQHHGGKGGESTFCKPHAFLLRRGGPACQCCALPARLHRSANVPQSPPSMCTSCATPTDRLLKPCSSLSPSPGCPSAPASLPVSAVLSCAFFLSFSGLEAAPGQRPCLTHRLWEQRRQPARGSRSETDRHPRGGVPALQVRLHHHCLERQPMFTPSD